MFIAYFVAGPLQNNCYLLAPDGGDRGIVIDAPLGASETVERALAEHGLGLAGVLLTHGHIDHCAEAARLADAHDAPVLVSAADRVLLTRPELALSTELAAQLVALLPGPPAEPRRVELYDPSRPLSIGGLRLTVLPAPGHTPGSVLLRTSTGDDEVASPATSSSPVASDARTSPPVTIPRCARACATSSASCRPGSRCCRATARSARWPTNWPPIRI